MTKSSIYDVLAALGASATLLVGCADAAPPVQAPVQATEVPSAIPAASAVPDAPAAAAPAMPAAPPPASVSTATAAAAPATTGAAPKAMPPKIKGSKRKTNKSAQGCCGEGTCAPC